jgi:hypothetical protein
MIRAQDFDLLVLSKPNLSLIDIAEGVDVLALDGFTMPLELLWLVEERLNRQQRACGTRRKALTREGQGC